MDSHEQPIFHLEVTVPRIVFATGKPEPEAATTARRSEQNPAQYVGNEPEQVHLLFLDTPPSQSSVRQQSLQAEPIPTIAGQERFHVLRLEKVPAIGEVFLLQVMRQGTGEHRTEREGAFVPEPADEVAFRVEFRPPSAASAEAALQSGISQVVILLDNEGMPTGYSIDGTETDS